MFSSCLHQPSQIIGGECFLFLTSQLGSHFFHLLFPAHLSFLPWDPGNEPTFFSLTPGTFFQSSVSPEIGLFPFSSQFHPLSALFLCSQQAPSHHAVERYFKENCFTSLLERCPPFPPFSAYYPL